MPADIFSSPGAQQWEVPTNLQSGSDVIVEIWGAGGAGGDYGGNPGEEGGGGGGGAYSRFIFDESVFTPEGLIDLFVGADGENSWFINSSNYAEGGNGGTTNGPGGVGGVFNPSADASFSGGSGGDPGQAFPSDDNPGGGGGGAGDSNPGDDGDDGVDGGGGGGGGAVGGGAGGTIDGGAGQQPGGGGAGGGEFGASGGAGGHGKVVVTYTINETHNVQVSDTVKSGDTHLPTINTTSSTSDIVKSGDQNTSFNSETIDIVKSGDNLQATISLTLFVSEGSKSGDNLQATGSLTLFVSDTVESGDTNTSFNSETEDTVESSDIVSNIITTNLLVTDGVRNSDTYQPFIIYYIPQNIEQNIEDELDIIQDLFAYRTFNKSVEHELIIEQFNVRNTEFDKEIEDVLDILQDIEGNHIYSKSVEDNLIINHDVISNIKQVSINHTLTVTQIISVDTILQMPKTIIDDLTINQDILYTHNTTKFIQHILSNIQTIKVTLVRNNEYFVPFVGFVGDPSGSFFNQPQTNIEDNGQGTITVTQGGIGTAPTIPDPDVFYPTTLSYPVISPTSTIILPAPLFGNREELQVTRIQRETIDNDLKVFVDSNWPKVRTFRYSFEGISDTLINDFYTFLLLTLGLEIKIIDYENHSWKGFIITPDAESAELSNDECDNSLIFEFIGIPLV